MLERPRQLEGVIRATSDLLCSAGSSDRRPETTRAHRKRTSPLGLDAQFRAPRGPHKYAHGGSSWVAAVQAVTVHPTSNALTSTLSHIINPSIFLYSPKIGIITRYLSLVELVKVSVVVEISHTDAKADEVCQSTTSGAAVTAMISPGTSSSPPSPALS